MISGIVNGIIWGLNTPFLYLFVKLPFLIFSLIFKFFNFIIYDLFNFLIFGTTNPSITNFSFNPIFLALIIPSVFIIIFIGINAYRKNLKDPTSKALKNFANNLPKYVFFTIIIPFLVLFLQAGVRLVIKLIQLQFTTSSNGNLVNDTWNLLHTSSAWTLQQWSSLGESGSYYPDYDHWWNTHYGWGIETIILSIVIVIPIVFLVISLTMACGKTVLSLVYNIVLSPLLNTNMLLEFNESHRKWLNDIKNAAFSLIINSLSLQLFMIMSYLSINYININEVANSMGLPVSIVSLTWRIISVNLLVALAYKLPGMIIVAFGGELAHTPQNYGNKMLSLATAAIPGASRVLGGAAKKATKSSSTSKRKSKSKDSSKTTLASTNLKTNSNLDNLSNNLSKVTQSLPKTKTFKGAKLSTQTTNALKKAGFKNLNEVAKLDDKALSSINGIGQKRLVEIKDRITKFGLSSTEIPTKTPHNSNEKQVNKELTKQEKEINEFNKKFKRALSENLDSLHSMMTHRFNNKDNKQNNKSNSNKPLIKELREIKSVLTKSEKEQNDKNKFNQNSTNKKLETNNNKLNPSNTTNNLKQSSKPTLETKNDNLNKLEPKTLTKPKEQTNENK